MSQQNDTLARNVFRISVGLMIAALFVEASVIVDIFNKASGFDFTDWRIYVILLAPLSLLIGTLLGQYWGRREKSISAFYAIVAGGLIFIFLLPFAARNSVAYILFIALGFVVFSAYILPEKASRYVILVSVSTGIVALLIDVWVPWSRSFDAAANTPVERIVAGIAVALLVLYVSIQAKNFNLRTKLVLLFSLLPVGIIGIIAVLVGLSLRDQLERQLAADAQVDIAGLSTELTGSLDKVESDIRFLAESAVLSSYLSILELDPPSQQADEAWLDLKQELLNFAQAQRIYDQVRYIDASGQEVIRINTTNRGHSISVFNSSLRNRANQIYFEETMNLDEGEVYISDLDLNVERGEIETPYQPVIRYAMPVVHNGQTKGIVIINVKGKRILERLDSFDVSRFLIDPEGYYLYHPDEAKQWSRDLQTGRTLVQEIPTLSLSTLNEGTGIVQDGSNLFAYQPVTLTNEQAPRWFLIETIDNAFVTKQVRETFSVMQAIASITVLFAPVVALLISRTIAVPITDLTKSAEQIAAGNLGVEIKVRGRDEIATLAATFKMMAQRLRRQVGGLEVQATERTRDLMLTADISVRIGQLRDLDQMLNEAVRLIRDRYDLYYVQVYLSDAEEKLLTMQAGSGEIGRQLQQRRFQLPIKSDSINGMAAAEKRSIIVTDTETSSYFRPNSLLPETRSEAAVPLLISDQVAGVLDLQSHTPLTFSEENRPVFELLAGQLAAAINNVRLYQEAETAREIADKQARIVIQQAWDEFLDGIQNQKSIGYCYHDNVVQALDATMAMVDNQIGVIPISIAGEFVGSLAVEKRENGDLSESEEEFVTLVANQVAQRIDNLRLLSEAERFRQEAEAAAKRMIHESWQAYHDQGAVNGYQYDRKQVQPVNQFDEAKLDTAVRAQIDIQGVVIAELFLEGVNEEDENAYYLIRMVADYLSGHIENLRLSAQTEKALADTKRRSEELAVINEIAGSVAAQLDTKALLETVLDQIKRVLPVDSYTVALYDKATNLMDFLIVYDTNNGYSFDIPPSPLQPHHISHRVINNKEPYLVMYTAEQVEEHRRNRPPNLLTAEASVTASVAFVPLLRGNKVIGVLSVQSYQLNAYTEGDLNLLTGLASYVTTALTNAQLFQEIQRYGEKERIINQVSQKIQSTLTMEDALQTAVTELGNALNAPYTQVKLGTKTKNGNSSH